MNGGLPQTKGLTRLFSSLAAAVRAGCSAVRVVAPPVCVVLLIAVTHGGGLQMVHAAEATLPEAREFAEAQVTAKYGRLNAGEMVPVKNSLVPDLPNESGIFSFATSVVSRRREGGSATIKVLVSVRNVGGDWRLIGFQESIGRSAVQESTARRAQPGPDLSELAARRQLEMRERGRSAAAPPRPAAGGSEPMAATSPQQATVLQKSIRTWFAGLLAPALILPEPTVFVADLGGRFRVGIPLSALSGRKNDELSVEVRRIGATRWAIDNLRFPSSARFSAPDGNTGGLSLLNYSIGRQTARGVLDTALATESRAAVEMGDLRLSTSSAGVSQEQSFVRSVFSASLVPVPGGRVDFLQDGRISGWSSFTSDGAVPVLVFSARETTYSAAIDGISRARLQSALEAFCTLSADAGPASAEAGGLRSRTRWSQTRGLIDALRNAVTRVRLEENFDDATIEIGKAGRFTFAKAKFGMGAEAPTGSLRIWFDLECDRPGFEGLPSQFKTLVPSRIAVRPAISGIDTERAFGFLQKLVAGGVDPGRIQSELFSLLTDPAVFVGLESFTIESGAFRLDGSGRMKVFGPEKFGFEARLSATGYDQLVSRASAHPDLSALTGFLVMARGLSRMEGNRLTWGLLVTPNKTLINGIDVQQALGSAGLHR